MLLVLLACTYPLSEVRIVGATQAQEEMVRAEISAFEEAAGVGRVRLKVVRFEELPELGLYTTNRKLRLDEDLPMDLLGEVFRHELCHALDDQEGLLEEADELWDEVADALDEGATPEILPIERSQRIARSEGMAALCGGGPEVAGLLAYGCGEDPPWMEEAYRWLRDVVWREHPLPELRDQPAASSWLPGVSIDGIDVIGLNEPYLAAVYLYTSSTQVDPDDLDWVFDVRSGVTDLEPHDYVLDPSSEPLYLADFISGVSSEGHGVVLPDLQIAAVLAFEPTALPRSAERLLWWDGAGWSATEDGCHEGQTLLRSAEQPWLWWTDGSAVSWRRVGP